MASNCGISYEKLRQLIRTNKVLHKTLKAEAGVTGDELAKLKYEEEYITTESLEKFARYFSKLLNRKITFDDLIDIKD